MTRPLLRSLEIENPSAGRMSTDQASMTNERKRYVEPKVEHRILSSAELIPPVARLSLRLGQWSFFRHDGRIRQKHQQGVFCGKTAPKTEHKKHYRTLVSGCFRPLKRRKTARISGSQLRLRSDAFWSGGPRLLVHRVPVQVHATWLQTAIEFRSR